MDIKIDSDGHLLIKRRSCDEFKHQYCRYTRVTNGSMLKCGDWCPSFGVNTEKKTFFICGKDRWLYDELIEENGNVEKDNPNDSILDDLDNINLKLEGREN